MKKKSNNARPFLKWAGGKAQLIEKMTRYFPRELMTGEIKLYFEPFLGGGAVFFHVMQNFPVSYAHLFDINRELILVYQVIRNDVESLINHLEELHYLYTPLSEEEKHIFYYKERETYNAGDEHMDFGVYSDYWIPRAARMLFLNRTCYNGLYRLNSSGDFNVPFGRYKSVTICDADNLRRTSRLLQHADIRTMEFRAIEHLITRNSFVYFDPPYRPISASSNFTSYSTFPFGDQEQEELADLFRKLDRKGAKLMLSNSDPKNKNPEDDFFDRLYQGYHICRVTARRAINSDSLNRGEINELLIMNY